MKALVLAAGFGSRLGKITATTPKPLLQVKNKPILEFCFEQLLVAGISEVIVNTHHLAPQVENFIENYRSDLRITTSYEETLLGTAGTIKKHFDYLATSDFLVMHGDNYFTHSLFSFVQDHISRAVGQFGTLGTFESKNPSNCGVVVLNQDKTISQFHEKISNPPTKIANAAIYAFTPSIREAVFSLKREQADISKNLIPKIMHGLYTHKFEGIFVDIGTPEGLIEANS